MNYIQQALQTKSTSFHGDKVSFQLFYDTLATTIFNLQQLDKMKKSLFYGKDNFVVDNARGTCNQLPVECLSKDENSNTGIDVLHAVLGIATEAGELLEAIQIGLFGEDDFDLVNIAEEVGDVFWYQAILANAASKSFEEIQATNIAKLRARFPNKFTELDAQVRDLEKERGILELNSAEIDGTATLTAKLYATTDAQVWAKEFIKVHSRNGGTIIDEGFLIGWFANAIETAKTHERNQVKVECEPVNNAL